MSAEPSTGNPSARLTLMRGERPNVTGPTDPPAARVDGNGIVVKWLATTETPTAYHRV